MELPEDSGEVIEQRVAAVGLSIQVETIQVRHFVADALLVVEVRLAVAIRKVRASGIVDEVRPEGAYRLQHPGANHRRHSLAQRCDRCLRHCKQRSGLDAGHGAAINERAVALHRVAVRSDRGPPIAA